jgi:hypothetical protein
MRRMHAWRPVALVLLALQLCVGCGTVRLAAPEGRRVRMLGTEEPAEVRVHRTVWFWLWGGRPISDNTTVQDVLEHDLVEVRMRTEQTMTDNLVLFVTAFVSIVRRTLIVEGNTRAALE